MTSDKAFAGGGKVESPAKPSGFSETFTKSSKAGLNSKGEIKLKAYQNMTVEELLKEKESLEKQYREVKAKNLNLNMSRGKPADEQLDLSMPMMDIMNSQSDMNDQNGNDCRNYGVMDGVWECKELMGSLVGVKPQNVIVYGNASLTIMYDTVSRSMTHGVNGSTPWCKLDRVKFLCPAPGYDRHFAITEFFGIEMITIPMKEDGPDMDLVEQYVNQDPAVKGIWCVPKYSNPQGYVYSDETVKRFAALKSAAEDFRIFWDNAYCVHHLYDEDQAELLDILSECEAAGNPDMVYEFFSTSKITFAGAGVSALASSVKNLEFIKKQMTIQTISFDKINQLRHVRFLKSAEGVHAHMAKQAAIMRPKFQVVLKVLEEELGGLGIGSWTNPKGGYFISFDALDGCAKEIVAKAKEAGVILTGAGATYPYGKDPKDSNIRIAPSLPPLDELLEAAKLFALCVKLVSVEKFLSK